MAEKTWDDIRNETSKVATGDRNRVGRRAQKRAITPVRVPEASSRAHWLSRMAPEPLVMLADDVLCGLELHHYGSFADTDKRTIHVARNALKKLAEIIGRALKVGERRSRVRAYIVLITAAKEWPEFRKLLGSKAPRRFSWRWTAKSLLSIWDVYADYTYTKHQVSARKRLSKLSLALRDPDHPMRSI